MFISQKNTIRMLLWGHRAELLTSSSSPAFHPVILPSCISTYFPTDFPFGLKLKMVFPWCCYVLRIFFFFFQSGSQKIEGGWYDDGAASGQVFLFVPGLEKYIFYLLLGPESVHRPYSFFSLYGSLTDLGSNLGHLAPFLWGRDDCEVVITAISLC